MVPLDFLLLLALLVAFEAVRAVRDNIRPRL